MSEIEHAVSHGTDFHQFMLYTPLYEQMAEEGRLLKNVDYADVHGQFKFNFKHAAISREDSKRFLDWAFWRDFQLNGLSLYRISRTLLAGFKRYKDDADPRVRERFRSEMGRLSGVYGCALWALERQFRKVDRNVSERIRALQREFWQESGWCRECFPGCSGQFCFGRLGAKSDVSRGARPTSRRRFWSTATGWKRNGMLIRKALNPCGAPRAC
jgi:hypothetical protein